MTAYNRIKLKHALLKKDLYVIIGTIAGYHYSDKSKATHVYTTAGIFPCEETSEQISALIDASLPTVTIASQWQDYHPLTSTTMTTTATAPTADISVGATKGAKAQEEC